MDHRVSAGQPLGPWQVQVRERTARRLADGLHRRFDPDAPVHPALGGNLTVGIAFHALPRWILHVGGTLHYLDTVHVGDELTVTGRIDRVERRRNHAIVTIDGVIRRRDLPVFEITGMFSVDPDAIGVDLGPLEEVGPVDFGPSGDLEPAGESTFDLPSMVSFSGPGNFHSDADVARSYGYDQPVVQGLHVAAYALDLCAYAPGDAARYRFDAMVAEGDTVAYEAAAGGVAARGRIGDSQVLTLSITHPAVGS